MRKLYTLIFVGCISFTGFTAHAQIPGTSGNIFDVDTPSLDEMMQEVGLTGPSGLQTSAIGEGDTLVREEEEVPEENKIIAEAIDSKTKRYPPRLKIDFSEFPLRSLASTSKRGGETKTQKDIIVQRIRKSLRVPNIDLVMKDRTAILSGTVSTDRQRSLAAAMLRFEPGIDVVQNEIIVTPQTPNSENPAH